MCKIIYFKCVKNILFKKATHLCCDGLTVYKGQHMKFFLCVMGMVMIVEGLPYLAFPKKMKLWVQKLLEMPESSIQKIGFILMTTGFLMVCFGTM
jgi:uncharacterized protein YjeT (DUF2065 family)